MEKLQYVSQISFKIGLADSMTYTEISKAAGERLSQLCEMTLLDAAKNCLKLETTTCVSEEDIIAQIHETLEHDDLFYFAEATAASQTDAIKLVEARIRNGFTTGGVKIDLTKAPIWSDYVSKSRNIRYKIHSWLMIDGFLNADKISDDNKYLRMACEIALDWVEKFVINKESDEFAWYDMAVGQRGTKLAYILRRLVEIEADPKDIFKLIIAAEIHLIELSQLDRIATHSNHGLFQLAGLYALCKSLKILNKSAKAIEFGEEVLIKMLGEHFAKDGLHLEHSPDYHLYMVNLLNSFVQSKWINESTILNAMISKVEEAANWMCNPEGNTIPIGDSANNAEVTRRWSGGSGGLQFGIKTFLEGGLVVENNNLEKGITQLIFSAQFHSRQHKHADDQNVLYHVANRPILIDPGTYTYQYDAPERIYCESTRAHNCVEIDGQNYSRFRKHSYGSALEISTSLGPLSIHSGMLRHKTLISPFIPNNKIRSTDGIDCDVTHNRILVNYPGRFLAIIDNLITAETHSYIQWNHFHPDLNLRDSGVGRQEIVAKNGEIVAKISSCDSLGNFVKYKKFSGQSQPDLQGWMCHNGMDLIPCPAIGYTFPTDSSCIVTVIDVSGGATGRPYIRTGSSGKYIRFALTQSGKKVDIRIRRKSQTEISLESIIDGEEYSLDNVFLKHEGEV